MSDRAILKPSARGVSVQQMTMVLYVNNVYPLNYLLGKTDLPRERRKGPRRRGRTADAEVRGYRCLAYIRSRAFPALFRLTSRDISP